MDCSASSMKKVTNKIIQDVNDQVVDMVAKAKAEGCLFVVEVDSWKPKLKVNRRHYFTGLLSWVGKDFVRHQVCFGCEDSGDACPEDWSQLLCEVGRHVEEGRLGSCERCLSFPL